jgi:hypothetical protein
MRADVNWRTRNVWADQGNSHWSLKNANENCGNQNSENTLSNGVERTLMNYLVTSGWWIDSPDDSNERWTVDELRHTTCRDPNEGSHSWPQASVYNVITINYDNDS